MTQLGRYEILQQLATGPVADVLLARATGLEGFTRHVVIKHIRSELALDERFVKAFLDEARIGASLHHQNIVQVYDIDEERGAYYFTMEYVHGEDVRRLLLKVRELDALVPIDQVVTIGAAAAAGLHHAHEQLGPDRQPLELVHRDVSPGNILIGFDGSVKLVDFGLAKPAFRAIKTRTGSINGKAPYMSPELCCSKPIDRRSDIFALGIVLYEIATARRLFKGGNDYLTMAAIVEGEVAPPSTLRRDIPPALDQIIMRALAKAPEARFQTAYDLRNALETLAIDAELRTTSKALSDYMVRIFGARSEPWQADAPAGGRALDSEGDFDETSLGLVTAPAGSADRMAALRPAASTPAASTPIAATLGNPTGPKETDPDPDAATKVVLQPDEEETSSSTVTTTSTLTETEPLREVLSPHAPVPPPLPPPRRLPPPPKSSAVPKPTTPPSSVAVPRPPIVAAARPESNTDADKDEVGDEATAVTPPLFESSEPILRPAPASPLAASSLELGLDAVYVPTPPPPRPSWVRYLTVALGFAIPLAVGLGSRSCSHTVVYERAGTP